ncbi:MAG: hypothetical protein E7L40_05930 [Corynebacterium kroppenstedtii]|nr:hypothetical protein [Corynebacterium kroppenstedtii]
MNNSSVLELRPFINGPKIAPGRIVTSFVPACLPNDVPCGSLRYNLGPHVIGNELVIDISPKVFIDGAVRIRTAREDRRCRGGHDDFLDTRIDGGTENVGYSRFCGWNQLWVIVVLPAERRRQMQYIVDPCGGC